MDVYSISELLIGFYSLGERMFFGADLRRADLSYADLSGADLRRANLSYADLSYANLSGANLSYANLSYANLSGAEGILSPSEWLQQFESDDLGIIVYKAIGSTEYDKPDHWIIQPGSVLTEVCNPDRGTDCGCGVNFGTYLWVTSNYPHHHGSIWKCRIAWRDLAGVVVPFHTTGKARCERLTLVEEIDHEM